MPQRDSALRRRVAPSVPLKISFTDGEGQFVKTYRLAFNLNVLAEISEKTGLAALSMDLWSKLDANLILVMLWAALLPEQPAFDTRDKAGHRTDEGLKVVGSWFVAENQERAVEALWDAYLLYLPADQAADLRARRTKLEDPEPGGDDPLALPKPAMVPDAPPISDGSSSGQSADTTLVSPIAKSAS